MGKSFTIHKDIHAVEGHVLSLAQYTCATCESPVHLCEDHFFSKSRNLHWCRKCGDEAMHPVLVDNYR